MLFEQLIFISIIFLKSAYPGGKNGSMGLISDETSSVFLIIPVIELELSHQFTVGLLDAYSSGLTFYTVETTN